MVSEKNTNNYYQNVFTNSALQGIVNQSDYFDKDIANSNNLSSYYVVQKDHFIYNPRISKNAPYGPINRNKLNQIGVMSPLYLVFENKQANHDFLEHYFLSSKWYKYMLSVGNTGARSDRYAIKNKDFFNMPIHIPVYDEQYKIGKILKVLNHTINLHTKKDECLKRLKDALLLEMIPRKNMLKPKLYFKNENWVDTTLKSVLSIPKNERLEVTSPSQLLTVRLNLGGVQSGSNRETLQLGSTVYYKRLPGQFIYGKQNFFNGGFGIIGSDLKNMGSSGDVPALDIGNINPHYLFLFLSRKYYYEDKERYSSGTGSKRIHEKTLLDFDIAIPSKVQQDKIVKLINSIDKQIENNEHKISSLKLLKEKYLKDLFV